MAKFSIIHRLSKKETDELFIRFVQSLIVIRNSVEAANFVKDLLSESEVLMLARRLQIADLLIQGLTYEQIRKVMKVGDGTIARVQTWLKLYGEGYRTVIERTQKKLAGSGQSQNPWRGLKQKYPMYFWPELLLKEIVRSANARERKRLERVVNELRGKTKIVKELDRILKMKRDN
jgi:TrpR-related protein YerC/YecD